MSLLDHTIWWHVYPLGATGAPIRDVDVATLRPQPRLDALVPWLDHLIDLGCNGLLLAPIFASSSHGYDTLDHFRIDPRLGDDTAFDRLINEAHSRGIPVMLDGVFNHLGVQHPLVAQSVADGGGPVAVENGQPRTWEGHGDLAELDHENPATAELVTEVMLHWLRRGIAGWRLDVAYAVPSAFWARVTDRVREEFPDAIFLGEVIHGDYASLARDGHLDSITQYELWKGIWSSIDNVNFWELAHALERHAEFSERFVPNTFVGNHDVDRIADKVGDTGAALAAAILLTVPGMPSIYYGDEHAFRGAKGQGFSADDAVRQALPGSARELASAGRWLYEHYQALISLRRRHPWVTRGDLHVLDKQNEWIAYEVRGQGHTMTVRIEVAPDAQASIAVDGDTIFHWREQ